MDETSKEAYKQFIDKVTETFGPDVGAAAKDILDREIDDSIMLSYNEVSDLQLNKYPAIILNKKDETAVIYYDPKYGDFMQVTTDELIFISCYESFDYLYMDTLSDDCDVMLMKGEEEELGEYGNRFALHIPLSTKVVTVTGVFLDKVVSMMIPYDDLNRYESEELDSLLDTYRPHIYDVFRGYAWRKTDPFRGYYAVQDNEIKNSMFTPVISGWVGLGIYNDGIETIKKAIKEFSNYPILMVYPRSSNLLVTRFDMYVPKEVKDTISRWFKRNIHLTQQEGFFIEIF